MMREKSRRHLSGRVAGLLGGCAAGFAVGALAGVSANIAMYLLANRWIENLTLFAALGVAAIGGVTGYHYWVKMLARRTETATRRGP